MAYAVRILWNHLAVVNQLFPIRNFKKVNVCASLAKKIIINAPGYIQTVSQALCVKLFLDSLNEKGDTTLLTKIWTPNYRNQV